MKILCIFIDMLGAEYLNICNANAPKSAWDMFIGEKTGTVYTNCYTPAPDTPRSSGCMWTGRYPKQNGCDNRLKWPAFYMNNKKDNIWKYFSEKGYTINTFMEKHTDDTGLVPFYNYINRFNGTIDEFFINAQISCNSFNFIYLHDLHIYLDLFDYSREGYNEGNKYLTKLVEKIYGYYDADNYFDYIMIFSDHGFRMNPATNYRELLDDDRTKTFMYFHMKGDKKLIIDTKLRSNLDILPTMYSVNGDKCDDKMEGITLLDDNGHNYLLFEDHKKFSSDLGLTVERWAVLDNGMKWHWLCGSGEWKNQTSDDFDSAYFENIIEKKLSFYKDYKRMKLIQNRIQIKNSKTTNFSDGNPYFNTYYFCPFIKRVRGKKCILYGFGKVGRDYYTQLKENNVEIVACTDLYWDKCDADINVEGFGAFMTNYFDYVIICMVNEENVKHSMKILEQIGVPLAKMLWEAPLKKRMAIDQNNTG